MMSVDYMKYHVMTLHRLLLYPELGLSSWMQAVQNEVKIIANECDITFRFGYIRKDKTAMWIFDQRGPNLFCVGYFHLNANRFVSCYEFKSREEAERKVNYLNGGNGLHY